MSADIVLALMLVMFSCGSFIGHTIGYRRGLRARPGIRRVGRPE